MEEPSPDVIAQWKQQYGRIYSVDEYIFRAISIGEYESILARNASSAEIEEAIVCAALLAPSELDFDALPAGVITGLYDEVTNISGFGDPKVARQFLLEYRETADSVYVLMKAIILAAMPKYTEEDLNALTFPELMRKVTLAEKVIEVQQAIQAGGTVQLELIDPEEEEKKRAAAANKHNATKMPGQAAYGDPIAERLKQALQ